MLCKTAGNTENVKVHSSTQSQEALDILAETLGGSGPLSFGCLSLLPRATQGSIWAVQASAGRAGRVPQQSQAGGTHQVTQ